MLGTKARSHHQCLVVVILVVFVSALATHGATENGDSDTSTGGRSLESSISIHSFIEVRNMDRRFTDRTILQFLGRRQSNILTFKKVDFDLPRPQLWKKSIEHNFATESPGNATMDDVPAEWATVWYGEALGLPDGNETEKSSASFIVDAKGQIYGTILDGSDVYTISSVLDKEGNCKYEHDVVSLDELPDEWLDEEGANDEDDFISTGDGRRLDTGLRGGPTQSTATVANDPVDLRASQFSNPKRAILDVAVVYTEQAKLVEGDESKIHNLIGLSIFQTNIAFANSGSNIRIRLVKTLEDKSFPDDGTVNGWDALSTQGDGHFDYWEQVKNETGADSVVFIVDKGLPRWCGRGQTGGPLAMISRSCSAKAGRYSFAHELGHWFRAGHDSTEEGDFDNRGFIDEEQCFRTLMAYSNCECGFCPRILYYSNIRTAYHGLPVGTESRENNLRTMELYAPVPDQQRSFGYDRPVEFCQDDPCEEAPLMISENYNGNGRCPYIPGSDIVSSIRISAGISLEVFGDYEFQGTRRVFGVPLLAEESVGIETVVATRSGPTTNFESILNISMGDYGMDNRVSSFIIRSIPTDEAVNLCSTFSCSDWGGKGDFSVGSYIFMPSEIGEDRLSLVRLPPGWKIQIFEARRFRGESLTLTNAFERNHLDQFVGTNDQPSNNQPLVIEFRDEYAEWNNRVRSMIISTTK